MVVDVARPCHNLSPARAIPPRGRLAFLLLLFSVPSTVVALPRIPIMSKSSPGKAALLDKAPFPKVPKTCVVTGSSGFVGQRLVEMLVERGAKKVVAFDIAPKPADAWDRKEIEYIQGDISDKETVMDIMKGVECVWHLAAAVGPYHPPEVYVKVNYEGTLNVIEACKANGCNKIV